MYQMFPIFFYPSWVSSVVKPGIGRFQLGSQEGPGPAGHSTGDPCGEGGEGMASPSRPRRAVHQGIATRRRVPRSTPPAPVSSPRQPYHELVLRFTPLCPRKREPPAEPRQALRAGSTPKAEPSALATSARCS